MASDIANIFMQLIQPTILVCGLRGCCDMRYRDIGNTSNIPVAALGFLGGDKQPPLRTPQERANRSR